MRTSSLDNLQTLVDNLSDTALPDVARAILTTDLQPKGASREVTLRRGAVRIAGVTKGSGMIHPRMATTLGFVMTDALVPQTLLRRMLVRATELSYNRISVDGDTSTNDTLIVMANGASGVRPDPKEMSIFEEALAETLQSLARQIVRDGEGARKLISVEVHGAITDSSAAAIARAISISPLVKTAIAGSDPNWGRILSAAGNSGVNFDPSLIEITLQDVKVCRNGLAVALRRRRYEAASRRYGCLRCLPDCRKREGKRDVLDVRPHRRLHPYQCELPHLVCFLCFLAVAAEPDTPYGRMSKLAAYLSDGETVGALETFDKDMKGYSAIAADISALAAQTEVLCSIDPVADKEADDEAADVHHLDLDWYMMLKSRTDEALVERRRQRVAVTMQRFYKKSGRIPLPYGASRRFRLNKYWRRSLLNDVRSDLFSFGRTSAARGRGGGLAKPFRPGSACRCHKRLRQRRSSLQQSTERGRTFWQERCAGSVYIAGIGWRTAVGEEMDRGGGRRATGREYLFCESRRRSLEYGESQSTLAGVLVGEGKYQPALLSIQSALPLLEQRLGPDATIVADAICMQGDVYRALARYADAEGPLRRCAELRADDRGVASPAFGEAANSLAMVYQHLGKYDDADRYFNFAGKIREQSLGIQSLELAETLEAHALLLHRLGRDTEAKQKERLAAAIRSHQI